MLEKQLGRGLPLIVGNMNQLVQLFTNIISNSIDAVNAKSSGQGNNVLKKIIIRSKLSLDQESIQVKFIDTGVGIKQESINKIFNPFYTTKETGKGTGLGLSIVSKIVENHKGKVSVSSEAGEGTSFSFEFLAEEYVIKNTA